MSKNLLNANPAGIPVALGPGWTTVHAFIEDLIRTRTMSSVETALPSSAAASVGPGAEPSRAAPELVVIMPVFNEEEAVIAVLTEWRRELRRHLENFSLLVIDDGSTDSTPAKLAALDWPELRVHRHTNRGHGQSCLVGYREAAKLGARYVFQIDSDGQCDPAGFESMWLLRGKSAAIYGRRVIRDDGRARTLVSTALRWGLKFGKRTRLNDTNVPFRLYDAKLAARMADQIASEFDLANIGIALLLEPHGFAEVPIHFRDRQGGHPSVRWWGFGGKARRLIRDLRRLSVTKP